MDVLSELTRYKFISGWFWYFHVCLFIYMCTCVFTKCNNVIVHLCMCIHIITTDCSTLFLELMRFPCSSRAIFFIIYMQFVLLSNINRHFFGVPFSKVIAILSNKSFILYGKIQSIFLFGIRNRNSSHIIK